MKLATTVLVCIALTSASIAQIPNNGFENWVVDVDGNNNPVDWETTNSSPIVSVEPVSPAKTGNYAMKVKTVDLTVALLPGFAIAAAPYVFTETPVKFSAWVKSTIMPGDTAFIIVALTKGDTVIAATDSCTFRITASYTQYTYLEFPIGVVSDKIPDSVYVMVASSLTANPQLGTEIIVDDLAFIFGGATAVPDEPSLPADYSLSDSYPNPFNPETSISYQVPAGGHVRLAVYDLLGREVAVLVDNVVRAGLHRAVWNASGVAGGTYVLQMTSGSFLASKKVILAK